MVKLRYKVYTILSILIGVFLLGRCSRKKPSNGLSPFGVHQPVAPLPKNVIEEIIVNPENHTVTIQTPTGIKTVTLPDRKSIIDVMKTGEVKVTSTQFGLEHHVFMGYGLSDTGRFVSGVDGLYYKRLDLGIGLGMQFGNHSPIAFAKLSYNVYGNMQAGVIYGSNKSLGVLVSVRLF